MTVLKSWKIYQHIPHPYYFEKFKDGPHFFGDSKDNTSLQMTLYPTFTKYHNKVFRIKIPFLQLWKGFATLDSMLILIAAFRKEEPITVDDYVALVLRWSSTTPFSPLFTRWIQNQALLYENTPFSHAP